MIHCFSGISRSPGCLISYLIKKDKITYESAFKILIEKHENVKPNYILKKVLLEWQNLILNDTTNESKKLITNFHIKIKSETCPLLNNEKLYESELLIFDNLDCTDDDEKVIKYISDNVSNLKDKKYTLNLDLVRDIWGDEKVHQMCLLDSYRQIRSFRSINSVSSTLNLK